eukprot:2165964-Prymnesium_polylepis.1
MKRPVCPIRLGAVAEQRPERKVLAARPLSTAPKPNTASKDQGRVTSVIAVALGVRACVEQPSHHLREPKLARMHQCSVAVHVANVRVRALGQQCHHARFVVAQHRLMERGAS